MTTQTEFIARAFHAVTDSDSHLPCLMKPPNRNKDYFTIPRDLLRVQEHGRNSPNPKCFSITFIQYNSDQWFPNNDDLLGNRVCAVCVSHRIKEA